MLSYFRTCSEAQDAVPPALRLPDLLLLPGGQPGLRGADRARVGPQPAASPPEQEVPLPDRGEAPGDAPWNPAGADPHPGPAFPQVAVMLSVPPVLWSLGTISSNVSRSASL